MEAKEEERNKGRRDRQTLRIKTEQCLKMMEVWFRKCSLLLNNSGVVRSSHGIEPPGVSHRPRPAARERRGREDGHRAFLSQPHPAAAMRLPGLPMSLYTPGSSLFTGRHAGKFTIRQTPSGVFGNAAITMRDSPQPQTLCLFLN